MGKEIFDNMEFLMKEFYKEWDRSGEVKAVITLSETDLNKLKKEIAHCIYLKHHEAEAEDITFKKCVELSHENHILLRFIRKILKVDENLVHGEGKGSITISLDDEELKLYRDLFEGKEETDECRLQSETDIRYPDKRRHFYT